jgi:hypothetical protein
VIPEFDENGNLPPGIHFCEWEEFNERFGTNITRDRRIKGLSRAMMKLKAAGCRIIYINGSFVTSETRPQDYDACWEDDGITLGDLKSIDPVLYNLAIGRSDRKSLYGGDIFPASYPADRTEKNYLDFFKFNSRTNTLKGIIAIDLQRWEYDDQK